MKRLLSLIAWSSVAAFLVAAFAGDDQTVSLRIWLVAFFCWFGGGLLLRLFSSVPLVPSRHRLLVVRSSDGDSAPRASLHDFRSLESLLVRSCENERTYRQQLRPRLITMADHFLQVHHGISRTTHPERAAAVMGDVGWLLEDNDAAPAPAPTLDDLDRFLDRILPTTQRGIS